MRAFRKGIKRDTFLYVEPTKTTIHSLDMLYEEARNFVDVEREMKSTKATISKPSNKSNTSIDIEERKSFADRNLNPLLFKPIITLRGRPRDLGKGLVTI